MPNGLFDADIGFPSFTGQENESEKIDKIMNYLYMLLENLKYSYGNLGAENFNDTALDELGKLITDPITLKLESDLQGYEGRLAEISASIDGLSSEFSDEISGVKTSIRQNASSISTEVSNRQNAVSRIYEDMNSIKLSVTNYGSSSILTLTGNGIDAKSANIKMTGFVSFSDLAGSGTTTINGDNITTGTITGTTFKSLYSSSGVSGSFDCYFTGNGYYNILAGSIYSYYNTPTNGNLIPALYISTEGNGYIDSALKLVSSAGTSIESGANVYIKSSNGNDITLTSAADINLNGNVYINGKLLEV